MKPFSKSLEHYLERAEEATQNEDWPQAIKRWGKVTGKFREIAPPEAWLELTQSYINVGDMEGAEQSVSEAIQIHPDRTRLLVLAGKVAIANKNWGLAEKRWQDLIKRQGNKVTPIAWANLAKAERGLGQFKGAEIAASRGLVKNPGNLEILIEAAEIATARKTWAKALDCWNSALSVINKQTNPNPVIKQNIRLNISVIKRLVNFDAYKTQIGQYSGELSKKKIAIVTSYTKGYDILKPPEVLDTRFDYVAYTDDDASGYGIFDIRPLPMGRLDDGRAIRYVKTHPHVLFKDYEVVVWIDASLMVVGDIFPLVKEFLNSGKAIGSGVHPLRKNIYEELEANRELGKEKYKTMKKQVDYYRSQGFQHSDLAENTLLMFNLKHPKLAPTLETWWQQILKFSRRDQLSFNYALAQNTTEWYRLTKPPHDIRNHPSFVITQHHSSHPALIELIKKLTIPRESS